jgi:hypothetical protein
MRISQLITILREHYDEFGDKEVFLIKRTKAYPFTFAGSGSSSFGDYFWMTVESSLKNIELPEGVELDDFRVPAYKPDLKIVK